jgi:hypothetical protein
MLTNWAVRHLQALSNKTDCNARGKSYENLIQQMHVSIECINPAMGTTVDKSLSSKMEKVFEEKTKLIISSTYANYDNSLGSHGKKTHNT